MSRTRRRSRASGSHEQEDGETKKSVAELRVSIQKQTWDYFAGNEPESPSKQRRRKDSTAFFSLPETTISELIERQEQKKALDLEKNAAASSTTRSGFQSRLKDEDGEEDNQIRLDPGENFPSSESLRLLPQELQDTLHDAAFRVVKRTMLPLIVLKLRFLNKRRLFRALCNANQLQASPGSSIFSSIPLVSRWEGLSELSNELVPRILLRGEVAVYCGENDITGLHILGYGSVEANATPTLNLTGASSNSGAFMSFGGGRTAFGGGARSQEPKDVNTAGSLVGDMTTLSHQPQRKTIRCTSNECVLWVLPRSCFDAALDRQPLDVKFAAQEAAIALRQQNMRQAYRVSARTLRQFRDFRGFTEDFLDSAVSKFHGRVVKEGSIIFSESDPADHAYLILSGTVRVTRIVGTRTETRQCAAPIVVGEISWVQAVSCNAECIATSDCDVFVLSRDALKAELVSCPSDLIPKLRPGDGGVTFLRYLSYAQAIPLIRDVVPSESPCIKALAACFTMRLVPVGATLLGQSGDCDRILFILDGKACMMPEKRPLHVGECIGFALTTPHRWSRRVVVFQQVEALEIACDDVLSALSKFGYMKAVKQLSDALLFPVTAQPITRQRAEDAIADLKNPPMYPISLAQALGGPSALVDCRKPTVARLRKLKPIALRCPLSSCITSSVSKANIRLNEGTVTPLLDGPRPSPKGSSQRLSPLPQSTTHRVEIQPLVLGKPRKDFFKYESHESK